MNKLSLVGMQLPEKYKENFDVSSDKALRLELRRAFTRNSPLYIFQGVASLPTKACSFKNGTFYLLLPIL